MKKWILLLTLALLFNAAVSRAEGNIYYTNNEDRYYHLNENCDRPASERWSDGMPQSFYEREIYRKYEITEAAALEFEKTACPVCVKAFEPVYLGDHMPEWSYAAPPWEINGLTDAEEAAFRSARPQAFLDEIAATDEAFEIYYAESYNDEADRMERKHDYPAFFAGKYANNAGCISYEIVDPGEEILRAFEEMFGGGAWIVPAKYGYDEIYTERERIFSELISWCAAHPELDVGAVSAGGPAYENYAVIGISGADWQQAAAAFEDTAPIYIHFSNELALEWASGS